MLDLETKERYLRSALSFCTKRRNEEVVGDLKKLEQRWHKLWLRCAEWKCLLEVAITQHGAEVSIALIQQFMTTCILQELSFNLYSNSDSSSDSSSSKILIKNTSPIQNLCQLKNHSILYPTYLK